MRSFLRVAMLAAPLAALAIGVGSARGDVTYVVQRGHTLESIAARYHVDPRALAAANHLKEGDPLRPGQRLVIPGTGPGARHQAAPDAHGRFERDVVRAVRLDEEFRIRMKDGRGRVPAASLKSFERLMRQGEAMHPPDPRLVALIGVVSNHFAGRTLEVVSGYRAYTPTQYTPQSRHNFGKALDFRVRGIPNEVLRDFCRTLHNTGCGYYPNSTFVHMDVRDASAYWVDLSHPGEPPHYERPGVAADEGTSDVTTESH
jgi:uncharacterized protein YcbK (DUF882 family)